MLTLPVFLITETAARISRHLGHNAFARRIRTVVYPKDVRAPSRHSTAD